jgi:hypothetical protein
MAKEGYSREKGSPPINREGGLSMRAHIGLDCLGIYFEQ